MTSQCIQKEVVYTKDRSEASLITTMILRETKSPQRFSAGGPTEQRSIGSYAPPRPKPGGRAEEPSRPKHR